MQHAIVLLQAVSVVVKSDSDSGVETAPLDVHVSETADDLPLDHGRPIKKRDLSLTALHQSEAGRVSDPVPGSSNHRRRVSCCVFTPNLLGDLL